MHCIKFACWATVLTLVTSVQAWGERLETVTEPYRSVSVPAPEIGVVSEILVKEGDEVLRSQVLARLDDDVLQASLNVARAAKDALGARRTAETELLIREKQLKSYRALHAEGNATARELDRAESDYQQAESRLQTVREDLEVRRLEYERVKAQLRQRVIESTIDGVVVSLDKEVGEYVSPTDPIVMKVVHLKTLKAVFSVPSDAARRMSVGQEVNISVGYPRMPCTGVIEFISPLAKVEINTVDVKVRIPNSNQKIPSGAVCHWDFTTPQKSVDAMRQAERDNDNSKIR